jgi:hypothetical protein
VRLAEGFPSEQPFHVCESFRGEPFHVDIEGNLNLCCMHAGVPGTRQDVGGNLHSMSLVEAHGGLLDVIHQAQKDRLAHIAQGKLDAWDSFPCNACLKQFGKPHWSDAGAVGPSAARQRWTGAWSLEHQLQRGLPESGQGARAGAGAGAGASAGRLDLDPRQGAPRRLPLV